MRDRRGWIGVGAGVGAGLLAGASGFVADRFRRRQDDALPAYESLVEPFSSELVVIADDGVPLHVGIDEPAPHLRNYPSGRPRPTFVLTHGFCLTSACWVLQRRALARAGYRVVVWDQRGHGGSEKGSPDSYRIDQLGSDLYRVIAESTPTGDLILVGHSMGGMTTMAFAERHPEIVADRVVGFAAVATSPGGIPLANSGWLAKNGKVLLEVIGPRLFTELTNRPHLLKSLLRSNRDLLEFIVERTSFASPVPRGVVSLTAQMILGTDLIVLVDFTPTFDAYDKYAALEAFVGVDTLVFNGVQDLLTPPQHSDLIVDAIPGAEHVLVREGGHVIMLEHPEVLNEQLLALAERTDRARVRDLAIADKPGLRSVMTPLSKHRHISQGLSDSAPHAR